MKKNLKTIAGLLMIILLATFMSCVPTTGGKETLSIYNTQNENTDAGNIENPGNPGGTGGDNNVPDETPTPTPPETETPEQPGENEPTFLYRFDSYSPKDRQFTILTIDKETKTGTFTEGFTGQAPEMEGEFLFKKDIHLDGKYDYLILNPGPKEIKDLLVLDGLVHRPHGFGGNDEVYYSGRRIQAEIRQLFE